MPNILHSESIFYDRVEEQRSSELVKHSFERTVEEEVKDEINQLRLTMQP